MADLDLENIQFSTEHNRPFSPWQKGSAFNTSQQYASGNRSVYYANVRAEYYTYMQYWVRNYLYWYDGYVPWFHNPKDGIFSTRIGSALVNGAARKVVGGRVYFKNKNKEAVKKKDANGNYIINKALAYISSEWADEVSFGREVKKAVVFAAAAGTSLMKLDRHKGLLVPKSFRFDSFYPTVGFNGRLIDAVIFIRDFTRIADNPKTKGERTYIVVEHRYFGDYTRVNGERLKNVPLVEYCVKYADGSATNGLTYSTNMHGVNVSDLPRGVQTEIIKAFSGIQFNKPILLPFEDSLGAELINWSDCVSALPELPFGDSLLYNIMPYLQSYDYYWSAFNTDMYTGRARVLMPAYMQSVNAKNGNYNTGLDSFLFTQTPNADPDKQTPTPIQFDLRSQSWAEIRDMIIQNIAINTGMNVATIASFLQDNNAARTAREISTEENETALFVDDKREIIEKPINRLLKLVTRYNGFTDDVVIRWSEAGLTNIYARTDMLATAVQNQLVSKQKAAQMFTQDDDEYQQAEEWDRIQQEQQGEAGYNELAQMFGGVNNDTFGYGDRGRGNFDTADGQDGVLQENAQNQDRQENQGNNNPSGRGIV